MRTRWRLGVVVLVVVAAAACAKKNPPVAEPLSPPDAGGGAAGAGRPTAPPQPVRDTTIIPSPSIAEDRLASGTIDEINRNSPFQPVFFDYDSAEISPEAQRVLDRNAEMMKKSASWVVTIEGHCDERGTAEYNRALGERRAQAARTELIKLGVEAGKVTTISYGKDRPAEMSHDDTAWSRNRRCEFVTAGH